MLYIAAAVSCDQPQACRQAWRGRNPQRRWQVPELIGDSDHIVTELISNALKHTKDRMALLRTYLDGDNPVIEVVDHSETPPLMKTATEVDITGRGLQIIDALAAEWGVEIMQGFGKRVWARLSG